MYVYCRNCKWDNGDYGYNSFLYKFKEGLKSLNPFSLMAREKPINNHWYNISIPTPKHNRWGEKLYIHILKHSWWYALQDFKYAFKYLIQHRKGTRFYTVAEFNRKNPNHECPVCKSKKLSVD